VKQRISGDGLHGCKSIDNITCYMEPLILIKSYCIFSMLTNSWGNQMKQPIPGKGAEILWVTSYVGKFFSKV
jgi:hypothetical protein